MQRTTGFNLNKGGPQLLHNLHQLYRIHMRINHVILNCKLPSSLNRPFIFSSKIIHFNCLIFPFIKRFIIRWGTKSKLH